MKISLIILILNFGINAAEVGGGVDGNDFRLVEKFIDSKNPKDRVEGAELISEMQSSRTPVRLILKLIADPIDKVKIHGYRALNIVTRSSPFSLDEARSIGHAIKIDISKEKIDSLFEKDLVSEQIILFIEKASALNSIFQWYPIVSPIEYQNWQVEIYGYLARRLTGLRSKFDDDLDNRYLVVIYNIVEPRAFNELIAEVLQEMGSLPEKRLIGTLVTLWQNSLCGKSGPMNLNLRIALKTKLNVLKSTIVFDENGSRYLEINEIFKAISE